MKITKKFENLIVLWNDQENFILRIFFRDPSHKSIDLYFDERLYIQDFKEILVIKQDLAKALEELEKDQ